MHLKREAHITKTKLRYYFVLILPFFLVSFIMRLFDNSWEFLSKYLLIASLSSYLTGKFINYLLKEKSKEKWNEIVGIGAICATEIVLESVVLVYPRYLKLFYLCNVLGSLVIGIGVDSIKRKWMLYFSLIILALFSSISVDPQLFAYIIPHAILPVSLAILALFGNTSIIGRAILLDAHVQKLSGNHSQGRMLMAKSIAFEALIWIFTGVVSHTFLLPAKYFLLAGIVLSLISIVLSRYITEKTHSHASLVGVKEILKKLKQTSLLGPPFFLFLICVLLVEVGCFAFLLNLERRSPPDMQLQHALCASISMYLGCLLCQCKIFKSQGDRMFVIFGVSVSIIGVIIYLITQTQTANNISFSIVGLGSGLFLPCFYSINVSFKGIHFCGLLIGMIDLIRTLGEWFGSLLSKGSPYLMALLLTIIFSFTLFLFNHLLKGRQKS